MYSFPNFEPVCCSISGYNCCFLTCIRFSRGADKVVQYSHFFHFTDYSTVFDCVDYNKLRIILKKKMLLECYHLWSVNPLHIVPYRRSKRTLRNTLVRRVSTSLKSTAVAMLYAWIKVRSAATETGFLSSKTVMRFCCGRGQVAVLIARGKVSMVSVIDTRLKW